MSDEEQTIAPTPAAFSALRAAVQEATRLQHRHVTLDHLFHVLLRDDSVVRILSLCGCDTQHLGTEMAEYLELLPGPSGRAGRTKDPRPDAVFASALQKAIVQALGSGQSEFGTDGLLVVILDAKDCYASMLLGAEGLARVELLRCISHGSPALPPLSPHLGQAPTPSSPSSPSSSPSSLSGAGTLAALVLHNDHYTAMDFVVHVLTQVFGLTEKQAAAMMMQVHKAGHAALGPYPVDVAQRLAEEIRSLAAAEEFPLLCTIEPVL